MEVNFRLLLVFTLTSLCAAYFASPKMQIQGRSTSSVAAMRQLAESLNVHVPQNWGDLMEPPVSSGASGEAEIGESNINSVMNSWSLPEHFLTEVAGSVRLFIFGAAEGMYSAQTFTFDAGSNTSLSNLLLVATKISSPTHADQPFSVMYLTLNTNARVKQQYTQQTTRVCSHCNKRFWKKNGCCRDQTVSSPRGHTTEELNTVRQRMVLDQYTWISQNYLKNRRTRTLPKQLFSMRRDQFTETLENLLSRKEVKNEMLNSYNDSILSVIQSNVASLKLSTQVFRITRISQKHLPRFIGEFSKARGFENFYSNPKYSQQMASQRFSYESLFTTQNAGEFKNTTITYFWVLGQTTDNSNYALNMLSLRFSTQILIERIASDAINKDTKTNVMESYRQLNISRVSNFTLDGEFLNENLLALSSPWEQKTTQSLMNMLRFIVASAVVPQRFRMLSDFNVEVTSPGASNNGSIRTQGRSIAAKVEALASAVSSAAKAVGAVIDVLKSSKSVTIERITRFGFKYFNQRSRILRAMNIPSSRAEAFMNAVAQDYNLPKSDSFLLGVTYSDDFSWEQVQYIYSPSKNGAYRCLTLFKNGDSVKDTASFFIVDINADWNLAPDLLLITTSKSRFGGLFSSTKQHFQEVPHVLTLEEATKLQQFFMLIAIGNMAQTMRVKTDISAALPSS